MPYADHAVRSHLRRLARQGRLVDTAFRAFREAVYPGAPPDQVRELRVAFFAGAAEVHAFVMSGLDEGDAETQADLDFMNGWAREVTEFHERTLATVLAEKSGGGH